MESIRKPHLCNKNTTMAVATVPTNARNAAAPVHTPFFIHSVSVFTCSKLALISPDSSKWERKASSSFTSSTSACDILFSNASFFIEKTLISHFDSLLTFGTNVLTAHFGAIQLSHFCAALRTSHKGGSQCTSR